MEGFDSGVDYSMLREENRYDGGWHEHYEQLQDEEGQERVAGVLLEPEHKALQPGEHEQQLPVQEQLGRGRGLPDLLQGAHYQGSEAGYPELDGLYCERRAR